MCFHSVHHLKTTVMIIKVAPEALGFCAYGPSSKADEGQVLEG